MWKSAKESRELDSEKEKWKFWSKLLKRALENFSTPIYIIVDAIDECDKPKELAQEFEQLGRLFDKVKMLFSSRPDNSSINKCMERLPSISISKKYTDHDMRLHIQKRLNKDTPEVDDAPIGDEFKREIEDILVEKANGLYETL
jgi:hypothetical protein